MATINSAEVAARDTVPINLSDSKANAGGAPVRLMSGTNAGVAMAALDEIVLGQLRDGEVPLSAHAVGSASVISIRTSEEVDTAAGIALTAAQANGNMGGRWLRCHSTLAVPANTVVRFFVTVAQT